MEKYNGTNGDKNGTRKENHNTTLLSQGEEAKGLIAQNLKEIINGITPFSQGKEAEGPGTTQKLI